MYIYSRFKQINTKYIVKQLCWKSQCSLKSFKAILTQCPRLLTIKMNIKNSLNTYILVNLTYILHQLNLYSPQ